MTKRLAELDLQWERLTAQLPPITHLDVDRMAKEDIQQAVVMETSAHQRLSTPKSKKKQKQKTKTTKTNQNKPKNQKKKDTNNNAGCD